MHRHASITILQAGLVALVAAAMVAGCGGTGSLAGPSDPAFRQIGLNVPQVMPMWSVEEYRGDGHGGTKPIPDLVRNPEVSPQLTPPKLRMRTPPRNAQVPYAMTDWYYIQPIAAASINLVVLVQPTSNTDSDLFVLEAIGSGYDDGASVLGYSNRLPQDVDNVSAVGGYAPDWVAFNVTNTSGYPAAQVAIYGYSTGTSYYTVEVDKTRILTLNGPWINDQVAHLASDWFQFSATAGTQYTVQVNATGGNPDFYVYEGSSTAYAGGNENLGGGTVTYTATVDGTHYVRVIGASPGATYYQIKVTSP